MRLFSIYDFMTAKYNHFSIKIWHQLFIPQFSFLPANDQTDEKKHCLSVISCQNMILTLQFKKKIKPRYSIFDIMWQILMWQISVTANKGVNQ